MKNKVHDLISTNHYTVKDIITAECGLSPIVCVHCQSLEVTFDQKIHDAYCANCGQWQLETEND